MFKTYPACPPLVEACRRMPVKAAEEIDSAAIAKAGAWALQYLLDPKRGAGKRFPTKEEVHAQFPDLKLTSIEQIENWIFQKVGSTNLESISHDPQKIEEVLKETKKQEGQEHKRETILPPASLPKAATTTLVLAEIDTVLDQHKNQTAQTLTADLTPQVKSFIRAIAPKSLSPQQIDQLAEKIAQEVSRETLENMPKVVDMSQAPDVIADSLVSTVLVEPALIPNPEKQNVGKLIQKAAPMSSQIAATRQQDLEKVVVLSNISRISQFAKLSPQVQEVIDLKVSQTIESQHPLATMTETAALSGNLKSYVQNYAKDFKDTLAKETGGQIPSFAQLQKVQATVHQKTARAFSEKVTSGLGPQAKTLTSRINLSGLPDELADTLRLRPFTRDQLERLGLGSAQPKLNTFTKAAPGLANWGTGIALATNTNFQTQAYWTAMAASGHLPQQAKKLAAEAKGLEAEMKLKGSLPYPKAKRYDVVQTQLGVIASAEKFKAKNPRRYQTFVSWHNSLPSRQRLGFVSATSAAVTSAYFGDQHLFVPRLALARHPNQFLANRTFGAMAHGLGNFSLGNLLSISLGSSRSTFGMGKGLIAKSTPQAIIASKAAGVMGRILKVSAGTLLGLGIYFALLGQAALTGFLMGAAVGFGVGASTGAIIGFQVGVALAPFTLGLSIPVFTLGGLLVGGATGAVIGGLTGGLLGYGLASGNATALTTGVGTGVGGVTGGIVGGTLGSALGPLGTMAGAFVGAYVGALIGGILGYLVGHYVVGTIGGPATMALVGAGIGFYVGGPVGAIIGAGIGYLVGGGWAQIKDFFTTVPSTTTGAVGTFMGAAGSFLAGLSSSIWGGLTAAGGGILGGMVTAGSGLLGALGSISIPASLAAISVGSGVFGIIAVGTIVGITTAATFFNPDEGDAGEGRDDGDIIEDNEFFTLTKTANPTRIENNQLPKNITFTITLRAKDHDLANVSVTDTINITGENPPAAPTQNINGNPISPPCGDVPGGTIPARGTWGCSFTIRAETNWQDTVVVNRVTASATPPVPFAPVTGSTTATVVIGETICDFIQLADSGPLTWSDTEKSSVDAVCQELNRSPRIISLLQEAGIITLIKKPAGSRGDGTCGYAASANTVEILCDMSAANFAKYVIIHELGHIIALNNSALYNSFNDTYRQEGLVPTYPFQVNDASESFAEMIADYVIAKRYLFPARTWAPPGRERYPGGQWNNPGSGYTTFQNDWPLHYNFARNRIFDGVEY